MNLKCHLSIFLGEPQPPPNNKSSNVAAIVGGAIGTVCAIAAVLTVVTVVIVAVCVRRRSGDLEENDTPLPSTQPAADKSVSLSLLYMILVFRQSGV